MKKTNLYIFICVFVFLVLLFIHFNVYNFSQYKWQENGVLYSYSCGDYNQENLTTANALVLSCIDFRLRENIKCNLNNLNYINDYDEFILAGSSLGYNGLADYTDWGKVTDEHIKLAYDLHKINTIILIDHMYCGAYKKAYKLNDAEFGAEKEFKLHMYNLNKTAKILQQKYDGSNPAFFEIPNLKIKKYIISIDGGKLVDVDKFQGAFPL
jgi:hypothetical protein